MHDIKILEEQWKKYQKNKRKPYYVIGIVTVALCGLLYYLLFTDVFSSLGDKNEVIVSSKHLIEDENISKEFLLNEAIVTIQKYEKEESVKTLPTREALKEKITIPTLPIVDKIPLIEEPIVVKKHKIHSVKAKNIPHKKMHVNIEQVSDKNAYHAVEKRFNQFQDVDDALFLARVYYKKGAYKKSEAWALKTNKLDNTLEEGWIIFAKSKIKLGNIDEAKHILLKYIQQSNSEEAKILLHKITK